MSINFREIKKNIIHLRRFIVTNKEKMHSCFRMRIDEEGGFNEVK